MAWADITLPTDTYSAIVNANKEYIQSQIGDYMESQDGDLIETQGSISDVWTDIS